MIKLGLNERKIRVKWKNLNKKIASTWLLRENYNIKKKIISRK